MDMNTEPKGKAIDLGEVSIQQVAKAMLRGEYERISFDIREGEEESFERMYNGFTVAQSKTSRVER